MVLSQRPVRLFVARWFPLDSSQFVLVQQKSFLLAPQCDKLVRRCAVPPGGLPGLQREPPGYHSQLARIRSRAGHRCHICIWAAVCVSTGIGSGIPSGCLVLVLGPWRLLLPCPESYVDEVPVSSSEVSPSPF